MAERLIRVGNGFDVHKIEKGLVMHLGGVVIDCDCGFVAHSDGDVAIHALCDALLGSLALGDIGHHFPDTSPEWKGADSRDLLAKVMAMVRAEGWELGNADITIALQAPKIAGYVPSMRQAIARAAGVPDGAISVKATTTEHLGFTGRGEGCAVWATATVYKQL